MLVVPQALNLILVAAPELSEVRERLKRTSHPSSSGPGALPGSSVGARGGGSTDEAPSAEDTNRGGQASVSGSSSGGGVSLGNGSSGSSLFLALFPAWCHSPVSAVTLCLLAQVPMTFAGSGIQEASWVGGSLPQWWGCVLAVAPLQGTGLLAAGPGSV